MNTCAGGTGRLHLRVLLVNGFFYPDVVSTAQHATDLARRLSRRGDEVTVVASRRSYADPRVRFAAEELWQGVRICACRGPSSTSAT
jgi:hypothetical protein